MITHSLQNVLIPSPQFENIDISQWPAWLIFLGLVIGVWYKDAIIDWLKGSRDSKAREKEEQRQQAAKKEEQALEHQAFVVDAERQDNIAIMQSMFQLQDRTIKQNERLIDFLMTSIDVRLKEIVTTIKTEISGVHTDLGDISKRWLSATAQMSNTQNQSHIMTIEISKLVERVDRINRRLDRLVAQDVVTVEDD